MADISKATINGTTYDIRDKVAIQRGAENPTTSTVGVVGQIYENTTNGGLFKCTAVGTDDPVTYTWAEVGGGPVITMTTTDPGEGADLAANHFIAVYEV